MTPNRQTELASRLEADAATLELVALYHVQAGALCDTVQEIDKHAHSADKTAQRASDLRAAAQAVRAMEEMAQLRSTPIRTTDGKLACVEVSRPDTHPGTFCMWKFKDFDLDAEMTDSEPGDYITLTYRELTEDEFKALGDFDGW